MFVSFPSKKPKYDLQDHGYCNSVKYSLKAAVVKT